MFLVFFEHPNNTNNLKLKYTLAYLEMFDNNEKLCNLTHVASLNSGFNLSPKVRLLFSTPLPTRNVLTIFDKLI